MRSFLYLILFLSILAGCSNEKDQTDFSQKPESIVVKNFSDSLSADTFKVAVTGKDLKDQNLVFTIHKSSGEQIYNISIKAKDLFDNYDATIDLKKKKNQAKFLQSEVDRFFEEENFMEPAVTEQEKADKNVPDKKFYEELRQSQLNGFIYRLGKEIKIYIGWSATENKVKTYYSCCKK